jgi:pSer/pThr/pTyr-binding forkhead associated (FHA) protein
MVYSPTKAARKLEPAPSAAARAQALLVGEGRRTALRSDRATIGRSRDCDVILSDPNVSRRHAEVVRDGDAWVVLDLGSTNGIKVNGRRTERAELRPGDRLTMGLTELVFELD